MVHGYAASQGFFFKNFDTLAKHFRVIAIDQLGSVLYIIFDQILHIIVGIHFLLDSFNFLAYLLQFCFLYGSWGASSRPDFTCTSTEG